MTFCLAYVKIDSCNLFLLLEPVQEGESYHILIFSELTPHIMTDHSPKNYPHPPVADTLDDVAAIDSLATESLFQEPERGKKRISTTVGAGIIAVAGAGLAYGAGVDVQSINHVLDLKIVPSVNAYPSIVDGMVAVNEGLRASAPVIAAGGIMTYLWQKGKGRTDPKEHRLMELAHIDYSGVDQAAQPSSSEQSFGQKINNRLRKVFAAGIGVAALTTLLVGGSSGVEHEVSNGPLRPVEQVFNVLAPHTSERHVLVQSPNNSFMDDSYLERQNMNTLVAAAPEGVNIVPFNKLLPNIDGRSGLVISVPDTLFNKFSGVRVDDTCETIPVILDEANETPAGGSVDINGKHAQVVDKMSNAAQMNRDVAIMSDTDMKDCLQGESNTSYYGAVVSGNEHAVRSWLGRHNLPSGVTDITQEKFEANNRKFWRANGTPILLQLMAYVGILGAFATGNERRSAMQRNVREIGILNAQGVSMKTVAKIESRRALVETNKAALLAAPFMPVMAAIFNMAEVGLKVGVGARELAVGYTVTLAAKLFGARRAVKRFDKQLDLTEVVKG